MAMSISAIANGTERKSSNDYRASGRKTKRKALRTSAKVVSRHGKGGKKGTSKRGVMRKSFGKMDIK